MIKWIKNNYKAIIIWLFFELVAVILYLTTKNLFYLLNFSYIGTCITVGSYLYMNNIKYARNVVQFAVGLYMLIYLGIISNENMQIEGFWYYLFLGVFLGIIVYTMLFSRGVVKIGTKILKIFNRFIAFPIQKVVKYVGKILKKLLQAFMKRVNKLKIDLKSNKKTQKRRNY